MSAQAKSTNETKTTSSSASDNKAQVGENNYAMLLFKSEDHHRSKATAMSAMRQNKKLCDVTILVGTEEIRAHRLVLCSASPYFNAMFNGDMAETSQQEVTLHGIDASAVQQIINYIYDGEILITELNVQLLLQASAMLQMTAVTDTCCQFLLDQLDAINCLGFRTFADAHACVELERASYQFAINNFADVAKTEEYLSLPFERVEELVSCPELKVSSEVAVLTAALSWLKHEPEERACHVAPLLSHIRMPLLPRDDLIQHVEAEPLVHGSEAARTLLLEAMKYHLLPEERPLLASPRTVARRPKGLQEMLVAVGGGSLFSIHCEGEAYSPDEDQWRPIAPMSVRRCRAGMASSQHTALFVVGGYDGSKDLKSAEMYDSYSNTWTKISPMGIKRSCLGVCQLGGLVYACGGYDGASCLNSVERFDPLNNSWMSCPAMLQRRRYCRVAVLDNCIYAVGGFDSTSYQASVERLDPRMGGWELLPALSCKRSSVGAASVNGVLYCTGGTDGTSSTNTGEMFNARRNAWEPIAAMQSRRSTHELVRLGRTLVALGGNDGSSSLSSCERYNPTTDQWTLITAMLNRRSAVCAAALQCFSSW